MTKVVHELGDASPQVSFKSVELVDNILDESLILEAEVNQVVVIDEHGDLLVVLHLFCLVNVVLDVLALVFEAICVGQVVRITLL
jgi:hypothetical protein